MSYKVVKDHLMWEVGVVGNLLALAEVLMATGSFGLAALNTIISGSVTADQLIAAHNGVTLGAVKAGVTLPVSIAAAVSVTETHPIAGTSANTVQTAMQNALSVQGVELESISNTAKATLISAATTALNDANSIDISNHPTSMSVTETNPLSTISTTGHPTSVTITGTVPVSIAGTVDVAQVGHGFVHWASGTGSNVFDIHKSDGTSTGYTESVITRTPNGVQAYILEADRIAYRGSTVIYNATQGHWQVIQMGITPGYSLMNLAIPGIADGVIVDFPSYSGSTVFGGWTIRRNDGTLLLNQSFSSVNPTTPRAGQDFLNHNGKAVQLVSGTNWIEIRTQ
jgi:hypothetical protein